MYIKTFWTPVLYPTQQGHGNPTVSILKDDLIVGRIPKELSRICWDFIARDGEITCKITGQSQKSALGFRDTQYVYVQTGKSSSIT